MHEDHHIGEKVASFDTRYPTSHGMDTKDMGERDSHNSATNTTNSANTNTTYTLKTQKGASVIGRYTFQQNG